MRNGKVPSDRITVETTALAIPQLIQATGARQYDVIQTAVIAIPPAQARGLQTRLMGAALQASPRGEGAGIWVKADSPIRTVADLRGKTLGSYGLRSTGYTIVRFALKFAHNLNVALEGGDFRQVEIQAPNLPAALAAGQIDAATLIHSQAFRARQGNDFRVIVQTDQDIERLFQQRFVSAINIAYPEKIAQRPEAYREFNRMFRASARYAVEHPDEVFAAVGRDSNLPPAFFQWWFSSVSDVPGIVGEDQLRAIETVWRLAREMDLIPDYPNPRTLIAEQALRE
jgi:NitT/TauT family transport system substrate-binding protein